MSALRVPSAVNDYFRAIDDGDPATAAACFAEDAVVATPPPVGGEAERRVIRRGRAQLMRSFVERGHQPWRHKLTYGIGEGDRWVVAGDLIDGASSERLSTFVVVVKIDGQDQIEEFRSFRRLANASAEANHTVAGPWLALANELAPLSARTWLAEGLSRSAHLSLPSSAPTPMPIASDIETVHAGDGYVALYGSSPACEVLVVADGDSEAGVTSLRVHWCRNR